jgi:hypothetical protein
MTSTPSPKLRTGSVVHRKGSAKAKAGPLASGDTGSGSWPGVFDAQPGTFTEYDAYRRQQLELGRDLDADEISDEWWQTGVSA